MKISEMTNLLYFRE